MITSAPRPRTASTTTVRTAGNGEPDGPSSRSPIPTFRSSTFGGALVGVDAPACGVLVPVDDVRVGDVVTDGGVAVVREVGVTTLGKVVVVTACGETAGAEAPVGGVVVAVGGEEVEVRIAAEGSRPGFARLPKANATIVPEGGR